MAFEQSPTQSPLSLAAKRPMPAPHTVEGPTSRTPGEMKLDRLSVSLCIVCLGIGSYLNGVNTGLQVILLINGS